MDELDDFFSDISKVETTATTDSASSEDIKEPSVKKTKVEATYVAKPQVISAKPQPAVRSAPPPTTQPPIVETLATDPHSMIPAPAPTSGQYGSKPAITHSSYQSLHMGMSADEARLIENQQRGYDYDKQQKMTASGGGSNKKHIRTNADGKTWVDPTLEEWPENDYRLFVGDLGNDCTDDLLVRAFSKYPSYQKAKVVRDKFTTKAKGFGFVSFSDPFDMVKCLREMNGKYIGNRPIRLTKSTWKEQEVGEV